MLHNAPQKIPPFPPVDIPAPTQTAGEPKFAPGALGVERQKKEKYWCIHFLCHDSVTCRNSGYRWCARTHMRTYTLLCFYTVQKPRKPDPASAPLLLDVIWFGRKMRV